jgi:flavin-dependent dehydrogenase
MHEAPQRARLAGALPAIAVGGGLAGAAFALELARNGHPVMVLERTRGPHHKVCGEFLSEEGQAILRAFGIDARACGAVPVTHFRLTRGTRQATARLPFAAVALSRLRLDELLLAAAERAGARVVRGVRATGIAADAGGVAVTADGRAWRAAAVALATGKRSLRGFGAPPGSMVGFKLHLDAPAAAALLAEVVQLTFYKGGYVGACLIEEGILSLAWVMQERLVRAVGTDWNAQRAFLQRQSALLGAVLDRARPVFAKPLAIAAIPYGFLRSRSIAPEVFAVGDQLAVIPSFTGDGMAIALYSGLAAARAVLQGENAAQCQRHLVAPLRRQFRLAGGVGWLLDIGAASPAILGAAHLLPSLVTRLADATRLSMAPEIAALLGVRRRT